MIITDAVILDGIPFVVDDETLLKRLRLTRDSEYADRVLALARQAEAVARPKALFRPAYIEAKGEDYIVADGIKLTSKLWIANTGATQRIFPYLVTCGQEIAHWAGGFDDVLDEYTADVLQDMARKAALTAVVARIDGEYRLENASSMNPGSLKEWPIQEQTPLFALFGGQHRLIGVELTDSLLMRPVKSVSGIRFAATHTFVNCRLCPRQNCPSRLAPWSGTAGEAERPDDGLAM